MIEDLLKEMEAKIKASTLTSNFEKVNGEWRLVARGTSSYHDLCVAIDALESLKKFYEENQRIIEEYNKLHKNAREALSKINGEKVEVKETEKKDDKEEEKTITNDVPAEKKPEADVPVKPEEAVVEEKVTEQNAEPEKEQTEPVVTDNQIEEEKNNDHQDVGAMTEEEIEESKEKIGNPYDKAEEPKNKTDDKEKKNDKEKKTPASKTANKPKGKKRKVVKRKKFDWRKNFITRGFTKTYVLLKGLFFGENVTGRTKDYVKISLAIVSLRSDYKKQTPQVNNNKIAKVDKDISASTMLTIEEKKRLYKKIAALSKTIERYNRRKQAKAMKESKHILNEFDEEMEYGLGR